jgi:hypothetical protein
MSSKPLLTTASILLLTAACGCSKKPPPVAAAPLIESNIDWIDTTKNGLSRLDKHDRAIVVIFADWDLASQISLRSFETPATLQVLEHHQCQPFKYDATEGDDFDALQQRFPEWTKEFGRVLLLEKGKFIAELKLEDVEQELQTRYRGK